MIDLRQRSRACLGLYLVLASIVTAACTSDAERLDPASATYVGREGCVDCHASYDSLWVGSDHDLAMQEVSEATVLGDFEGATITQYGVESRLFREGGEYRVRTDGPTGELEDYSISYVFGVEPLQQYLIEFPGGRQQTLALTWDARPEEEGGQRWYHIYPDEPIPSGDILHWTGPAQNWNYMCAECHSTNLQKNYDVESDTYQTSWSELDVSCEACHGPGSTHVAWAEAYDPGDGAGESADQDPGDSMGLQIQFPTVGSWDWVFDEGESIARREPEKGPDVQIEMCARCHSRRMVIWKEYAHGQPLLDTHQPRLLTDQLYYPDGQVLEEVYVYGSFLQSKMYMAGVTCSDCHDPHSLEFAAPDNAVCGKCHLSEKFDSPEHHVHDMGTEGAKCVACHAPDRNYMVVDPRNDHSFRIPRPDLTQTVGAPDACTRCHSDQTPAWSAEAIELWYGSARAEERAATPHYGQVFSAARLGFRGTDLALSDLVSDPERPDIVRATALYYLRRYRTQRSLVAIESALSDANPLVRAEAVSALAMLEPQQRPPLAFHMLNDPVRAVRLAAAQVLADVPRNQLTTAQSVALNAAIDEYVQGQLANADRPTAHLNIGVIEAARGRPEASEAAYRTALRIGPWFIPTYVNLADLYRLLGRDLEGEIVLREALELAPDNADVHHSLGLLLTRLRRTDEALEMLGRATELDPASIQYNYVYAVALNSLERADEAIAVLERSLETHPYDRTLLFLAGAIHRDRGELNAAIGYLRRLLEAWPDDAEAAQFLAALEAEVQAR